MMLRSEKGPYSSGRGSCRKALVVTVTTVGLVGVLALVVGAMAQVAARICIKNRGGSRNDSSSTSQGSGSSKKKSNSGGSIHKLVVGGAAPAGRAAKAGGRAALIEERHWWEERHWREEPQGKKTNLIAGAALAGRPEIIKKGRRRARHGLLDGKNKRNKRNRKGQGNSDQEENRRNTGAKTRPDHDWER